MKAISGAVPSHIPQAPKSMVDIMQTMLTANKTIPGKTPASHSPLPEQGKGAILNRFDSGPMTMVKNTGR